MMTATRRLLADLRVPDARVKTEAFASRGSQVTSGASGVAGETTADLPPPLEPTGGTSGGRAARPASDGMTILVPDDPTGINSDLTSGETVTFVRSGVTGTLSAGQTVLEAAEDAGVDIPYECRSGVCGQCKTRLLAGDVTMAVEDALSVAEKSAGWILACQAEARGGLALRVQA
jgi:ferredoxin